MKDYQARMLKEQKKLGERIKGLTEFIRDGIGSVSPEEQRLMRLQLSAMTMYQQALSFRVINFLGGE